MRFASSWSSALATCAVVLAIAAATASHAQVIEISASGDTHVVSQPSVFTADGVVAIGPERAAPSSRIDDLLRDEAARQALRPDLVTTVAWQESRFRQSAVSPKDAIGVMQLTRGTAEALGVDRYDLAQNIRGGVTYLRQLQDRYRGDLRLTLAAYNAGPGAVDRFGGVPPFRETQAYVQAILARLASAAAAAQK